VIAKSGPARYHGGGPGRNGGCEMLRKLTVVGLIWAAGCATADAERVNESAAAKFAQYERTGDVTTCMNLRRIDSISAIDEKTLLIKSGVNDYYVSDLSNRCSGSTSTFNRFQYRSTTGQLCRNDIIEIIDNATGMLSGSCGMGSFEKLTRKKPDESDAETPEE
jgi:hypothetical protein